MEHRQPKGGHDRACVKASNTDNIVLATTPSSCLLLFSRQNRFGMKFVLDESGVGMKLVMG